MPTIPRIGLFPARYTVGTGLPGAPTLTLGLLIDTPRRTVIGGASITQAVNPPLDFHADTWGSFSYMALMPPVETPILMTLQGNTGGPESNSITTFRLHLVLNGDWHAGVANYSYLIDGRWQDISNVPAKLDLEFVPLEPGPVIPGDPHGGPTPLYGVSIQHAVATGDLAHMKTLATFAQQQLDSREGIKAGLSALNEEIARLEAAR
ncbi:DUF1842 domain-containing protein [Paraburkholderia madseniana]|jgi:hypothetical protein|uniref:DUF1842 domain-containing protein n=1 Tax=Paraburkholderia madseniana TaxID=2599607 RepID=UPI0015C55166|nr:DUF1842 domain-containing protein [Paraburkholderia madseniana]NPT69417.1 DUF1842 domain-containing protein [Paraburkholderia madseniana]